MNPEMSQRTSFAVLSEDTGNGRGIVTATETGIRLVERGERSERFAWNTNRGPDLVQALTVRGFVSGAWTTDGESTYTTDKSAAEVDHFAATVLVVPRSVRWLEAVSTALVGNWCAPLRQAGHLPLTALGALKAEARAVHRQLVPLWRRRTRHGRVLSLDADLGGGLSLYDLIAADVDLLAHTTGEVFDDERLNAVLRCLSLAERQVVMAYAAGEGTTWSEAAAAVGAAAPEAFGERVRRKAKRLAAEQLRRMTQRVSGPREWGTSG
ncbi:hypothetical protein [Streptomyces sp. NPDC018059]|uniref:hypothetical protein n=1 Tax=Streptomyces sp. NPDC018059 TaxID=3365041 RepID=UPI003793028E